MYLRETARHTMNALLLNAHVTTLRSYSASNASPLIFFTLLSKIKMMKRMAGIKDLLDINL